MNVKTKFDIEQVVILKHDREKQERMITGISIRKSKLISYHLQTGNCDSWHYEFEIEEHSKQEHKAGFIK